LPFTVETRILRELGERLVRHPEVALLELIKNSYDADATTCTATYDPPNSITVEDTGIGMTFEQFKDGWMRIGTSAKEATSTSSKYRRVITGEKGIGRVSVRFLGSYLHLESVADDPKRRQRTRLAAEFDWPTFDRNADLEKIRVPYRLERVPTDEPTGTKLVITHLRPGTDGLDFKTINTGSVGILSPLRSLLPRNGSIRELSRHDADPGFSLLLHRTDVANGLSDADVAAQILEGFVLRAVLELEGQRLNLKIYKRGKKSPYQRFVDQIDNKVGELYCDIRFFPRRPGTFTDVPVDGRRAYSWIGDNAGVAVFDRKFRVSPYGMQGDDWLQLSSDAARNYREPRSTIAKKHFPMPPTVRTSTSENWMLRLPQSTQLVGIVQVQGQRSGSRQREGLVPAADREGFVDSDAFQQLQDLVRGAVEAIAYSDRELQREDEKRKQSAILANIQAETRDAIRQIQSDPRIPTAAKNRIIGSLAQTQRLSEEQADLARAREQRLEVMSLLGVVAGFMTHEFGIALQELESTHNQLRNISKLDARFAEVAERLSGHIARLRDFVTYSQGYIQGAQNYTGNIYPARPRLLQVKRIFGKYAEDRNITVRINADPDLKAPQVPVSLYNGIVQNLFTNALKAVIAKTDSTNKTIALRAWNEKRWHYLEVSDTGVGIPLPLRKHVFDSLFTTTDSIDSPLGSGMGLGLTLVKRGAEAFGGSVVLVDPPPGFVTCFKAKLPLANGSP